MTPAYYRGTHGVIVVYDVTSAQSFASLKRWFQEIGKLAGPPFSFFALEEKKMKMNTNLKVDGNEKRRGSGRRL
jgi:GTPase SAR1 family protein